VVDKQTNQILFTATPIQRRLFQDNRDKPKGKTSLDLNEARNDRVLGWQWCQLYHMQTVCTLLQTNNHTKTSSLNFNWPDALPGAQPIVSKSTEGKKY